MVKYNIKWKSFKKRRGPKAYRPRKSYANRRRKTYRKKRDNLSSNTTKMITREFIWGQVQNVDTFGIQSLQVVQPDLRGGTFITPMSKDLLTSFWHTPLQTFFSLQDLPVDTRTTINNYEQARLVGVTLNWRPAQKYKGGIANDGGMPVEAPRLVYHPTHSIQEMSVPYAKEDDALAETPHYKRSLDRPVKMRFKPAVIGYATNFQTGSPQACVLNTNPFIDTTSLLNLVSGSSVKFVQYLGAKYWFVWNTPPVDPHADLSTTDDVFNIYATYTVEMKNLR